MFRHLLTLIVLLCAGVAGAQSPEGGGCYTDADGVDWCVDAPGPEENMTWTVTDDMMIHTPEPLPCVTVEFCGEPEEDSDVYCVQGVVCGKPIR